VAHAGQELHGPEGTRLRLLSIEPELLAMEATYTGTGSMPPGHLHPSQAERFEVLDGAMDTVIGGAERRYEMGEVFEVPAATPHQMAADGPARVRWEVRPALRTAEFFEALYSGQVTDGAAFLDEFEDEFQLTGG
jgi:quercetin dioxygenase-like cupin family protein